MSFYVFINAIELTSYVTNTHNHFGGHKFIGRRSRYYQWIVKPESIYNMEAPMFAPLHSCHLSSTQTACGDSAADFTHFDARTHTHTWRSL